MGSLAAKQMVSTHPSGVRLPPYAPIKPFPYNAALRWKATRNFARNEEIFLRYAAGHSTFSALGAEYGLSHERVRQIVAKFAIRYPRLLAYQRLEESKKSEREVLDALLEDPCYIPDEIDSRPDMKTRGFTREVYLLELSLNTQTWMRPAYLSEGGYASFDPELALFFPTREDALDSEYRFRADALRRARKSEAIWAVEPQRWVFNRFLTE